MADIQAQAATQLANVLASTGMTVAQFTEAVQAQGLTKHGQMVAFFKRQYSLGHGNANLIAHTVREQLAGGPPPAVDLLDAQYSGKKGELRPIYAALAAIAEAQGGDVTKIVQKTGVTFRRAKQFALVRAPSSKRVELGLNLPATPSSPRVKEAKGMCSHTVNLTEASGVDDEIRGWIEASYQNAG